MRFGPLFVTLVLISLIGYILLALSAPFPSGLHLAAWLFLVVVVGIPATVTFTALVTWFCIATFKVHVGTDGIRCFDAWGIYRFVPWNQAEFASRVNLVTSQYLRVRARDARCVIWLPVQLEHADRFGDVLRRYEPTPGMLSRYFGGTDTRTL